jgi:general secretion pathway protein E
MNAVPDLINDANVHALAPKRGPEQDERNQTISISEYPLVASSMSDNPLFLTDSRSRGIMCLLTTLDGKSGVLMYSATHTEEAIDPAITEYLNLARVHGVTCRPLKSTVSQIAEFYKSGVDEDEENDDSAEKQRVVRIIRAAVEMSASDVRFVISGTFCRIRFRVHGRAIQPYEMASVEGLRLVRALYGGMCISKGDLDPTNMQDGMLKEKYAKRCGLAGSRVATRPAKNYGLLVTLRLLYTESKEIASLRTLGYHAVHEKAIRGMLLRKFGLGLVTGIVGSGKSTSIVTIEDMYLKHHNQEVDLITIEDPPEYDIPGDGAMQTPLTYQFGDLASRDRAWAEALRNCLRHAMDAIMVGELRDNPGAVTAFDIALSGHVVLSTMHTFDVFSTVKRLISLGVDPDLVLNPALWTGIINQSLVRVLCDCKIPLSTHTQLLDSELLERLQSRVPLQQVYLSGPGCPNCRGTGYRGRELVAEVLIPTPEIFQKFEKEGMLAARIYWVTKMRGMTKMSHALMKIAEGRVDPRHVEADVAPLNIDEITLGVGPRAMEAA